MTDEQLITALGLRAAGMDMQGVARVMGIPMKNVRRAFTEADEEGEEPEPPPPPPPPHHADDIQEAIWVALRAQRMRLSPETMATLMDCQKARYRPPEAPIGLIRAYEILIGRLDMTKRMADDLIAAMQAERREKRRAEASAQMQDPDQDPADDWKGRHLLRVTRLPHQKPPINVTVQQVKKMRKA